jgi:asparagine synthase (glutamine-hydrolysing)
MCGIAGIYNLNGAPVLRADLITMTERLKHRGPDGFGYYTEGPVGLGHARLSVIDIEGGRQPIQNENGTVTVVFNGEIYNFKEIRRDLEKIGHHFSTRSDTEVIVHLYETYGPSCVRFLRGMFAFALWDAAARTFLMARDPIGKKPLYYMMHRGQLLFASELKSILSLEGIEPELNPAALDGYLSYQYVPDPMTIFKNILKLPPGTLAFCRNGRLVLDRYWTPPVSQLGETAEGEQVLRGLLDDAVRLRLFSDVPLGAFLSGGLDSGLVVAQMARMMRQPVKTYTIGFDDPSFDERREAERVAEALGTEHHAHVVTCHLEQILPKLIYHFDEPFADPSAIPAFYLSEMARRGVTVALSGDGGDDLFAGYRRYVARKLISYYERIPFPLRGAWIDLLDRRFPEGTAYYGTSLRKKIRLFLEAYHRYRSQQVLLWTPLFTQEEKEHLYTEKMKRVMKEIGDQDPVLEQVREARTKGLDPISEMLWTDLQTYLPGDILTKVDRTSMAYGLEVRSPFLDVKVVEQVSRMPLSVKLNGLTTKYFLRKIAKDLLPSEVLHRPKRGFSVPLARWFKGPFRETIRKELLPPEDTWSAPFQGGYIRQLLEEHEEGRRDHSLKLWGLLVLRCWYKNIDRVGS